MSKFPNSTRRQFVHASVGALAAPSIVAASALDRGSTAPSDRVTVGIIGSGGRAVFETRQYPSFDNVEIVAVCDAQESRRSSAARRGPSVRPSGWSERMRAARDAGLS